MQESLSQNSPEDWEAILAASGMPDSLPEDATLAGDALDINDPMASRDRSVQAAREERSENIFDDQLGN